MDEDSSARHTGGLNPGAFSTSYLLFSLPLIAATAALFCCLVALAAVALLYVRVGSEGVIEFYQDLRFDLPLQTQLGAGFVSALYIGIGLATLCAAVLRAPGSWRSFLAIRPVANAGPVVGALFAATLLYAAGATLAISANQDHGITVSGPTDLVLLGTITANLVLLAPVAEEIFFRGWLYTGLRQILPLWPSYFSTVALFAAIHWDANHRRIFLVLPLALALGLLREITGSIKPTIALHATYNLIIVVITLLET